MFKVFIAILGLCLICLNPTYAKTHKKIIKVLSYNIRGFGWPLATDRGRFKKIGKIIKEKNPDFVLLQEAFARKSWRKISKKAGYKNNLKGPGMKFGKPVGSGLFMMTNHEVKEYRKDSLDFCDPVECLARKMVTGYRVQIEGMPTPIQIMNTHLQAQTEHDLIRARQVKERVIPFLHEDMDFHQYLNIFVGDFNFKPKHESYWLFRDNTPFTDIGEYCVNNQDVCEISLGNHPKIEMNNVFKNTNDRHFVYNPTSIYQIKPVKLLITMADKFKGGIRDDRLSDHWGYEVHYEVSWEE